MLDRSVVCRIRQAPVVRGSERLSHRSGLVPIASEEGLAVSGVIDCLALRMSETACAGLTDHVGVLGDGPSALFEFVAQVLAGREGLCGLWERVREDYVLVVGRHQQRRDRPTGRPSIRSIRHPRQGNLAECCPALSPLSFSCRGSLRDSSCGLSEEAVVGEIVSLLDRDVYEMRQVDRLLSLSRRTAGRWADGYERRSRRYEPLVRVEATGSEIVTGGSPSHLVGWPGRRLRRCHCASTPVGGQRGD